MPEPCHATATEFSRKFFQSYQKKRKVWAEWTKLMLAHPSSVLDETARRMGLHYYHGEPLRLDAVFSGKDGDWFPIVVAIEHEASPQRFVKEEVCKLLSIRCHLKVGITYTWGDAPERRSKIAKDIGECFSKVSSREDLTTEYLFLIGTESGKRISQWHSLQFRASKKPAKRTFQFVELVAERS